MWPALVQTANLAVSMLILASVFTAAFHFIPRSHPAVHVVVRGAILTTVGLTALKELFAAYFAELTSYSAYGVAGGVLALTTWIYVSSVVIFFGAQLTEIYAEKIGVETKKAT
jgi:membrane protein